MRTSIIFLALSLASLTLGAQKEERYTADFRFARGVYLTIDDWKANRPLRPEDIIFDAAYDSPRYFQYLLGAKQFRYHRDNEIVYVNTEDIFGYSNGEEVFHRKQYRFETIGKISLLQEVDVVDRFTSFLTPGEQYQATRAEGTGKLFVLDYETGDFFRFKPKAVEKLLQRDPELFQQYRKAKGKKRDKTQNFIKEYNFRHPVYFPKR
jgi:hypothetical protein